MYKEVGNEKYIEDMRTSVMKVTQLRNVVYFFFYKMCLYMYVYI